jgi:hypothetical protein
MKKISSKYSRYSTSFTVSLATMGLVLSSGFSTSVISSNVHRKVLSPEVKELGLGYNSLIAQTTTQSCQEENVNQYVIKILRQPWNRGAIANDLARACGSSAIPSLEKIFTKGQDYSTREAVVVCFVMIGDPSIKSLITILMTDADSKSRVIAAEALGYLRASTAINPLSSKLEDLKETTEVRQASASALGEIGGADVVIPLINAMKNLKNSLELRLVSRTSLIKIKDPAIDRLLLTLQDPDLRTRYWAVRALAEIQTPRSAKALLSNQVRVVKILEDAFTAGIIEPGRGRVSKPPKRPESLICQWLPKGFWFCP